MLILEVTLSSTMVSTYDFLLAVCNNHDSIVRSFLDILTCSQCATICHQLRQLKPQSTYDILLDRKCIPSNLCSFFEVFESLNVK